MGVRYFADQLMCCPLVHESNKYTQKHFVWVSKSEKFTCLHPHEVLELLERDELFMNIFYSMIGRFSKFLFTIQKYGFLI